MLEKEIIKEEIQSLIVDIAFDMLDMNEDHYVYNMLDQIKKRLVRVKRLTND